jgi:hypothetical protein
MFALLEAAFAYKMTKEQIIEIANTGKVENTNALYFMKGRMDLDCFLFYYPFALFLFLTLTCHGNIIIILAVPYHSLSSYGYSEFTSTAYDFKI